MRTIYSAMIVAMCATTGAFAATPQTVGAQVVAKNIAQIGAPMSGTIDRLPIEDGNKFQSGDLLVGFQCNQQDAALAHAVAQQTKAKGILSVQWQLRTLGSYSALELKTAAADVKVADSEVALALANKQNCVVNAPFSGRVSSMNVHNHQYVQAGTPLFEVLSDSSLEVEMIVSSDWLDWLNSSTAFKLKISENKRSYNGHINRIGAKVDAVSRTVKVYGMIDDSDVSSLLPGMSGNAEFTQSSVDKAPSK